MNIPMYYTLKQCDAVNVQDASMPYMKSLYSILNRVVGDGYIDDFVPTVMGLKSKRTNRLYKPNEIVIINSFRFEGNSNPADNVSMYIIETSDGCKGTLVSAFGTREELIASSFFKPQAKLV